MGVELIGAGGPAADAEAISLADWAMAEAGVVGATIRLGHVGLILEMLRRSGLPAAARVALVETFGEAAAEGGDVTALERGLDNLVDWLAAAGGDDEESIAAAEGGDDGGVDRLFRTLVPVINGRRQGHEIVGRLRRKWDLGHSLRGTLDKVRGHARALAALQGPPGDVFDRLAPRPCGPRARLGRRAAGAGGDAGAPRDRPGPHPPGYRLRPGDRVLLAGDLRAHRADPGRSRRGLRRRSIRRPGASSGLGPR